LIVHSSLFLTFVLLYSYALSLLCIAMVVSTFFSNARVSLCFVYIALTLQVAGVAGSLTNTVMSLIVFGLNKVTLTSATKWIMSIVPPFALTVALEWGLNMDSMQGGLGDHEIYETMMVCRIQRAQCF
jgi:hypothetical protein